MDQCVNLDSRKKQGSSLQRRTEGLQQRPTTITRRQEPGATCHIVAKNLPEGPSCFEVRNRAGLVLSQLAGLRLLLSIVHWPMVVRALVDPTMRPDFPALCRAVSKIVGDISSVSIEEVLGRHLEAVVKRRCVSRACPLCRMRGSLTCSELPPRTHLHHRRRELRRIGTSTPTSWGGSCDPSVLWR